MSNDPTVFVVDDDQAVRRSLQMLLQSVGLAVVCCSSAQDFLDHYQTDHPGCLLLDIRMPGMNGLDLQRALHELKNPLPVIVMTGHGNVPHAVRAIRDGALEFVEKPFSKTVILEHIRTALARDARQRELAAERQARLRRFDVLTARERQVMDLVVAGKASKEVAHALGISKKTVDVHRARVMQKTRADSLAQLVEFAISARQPALALA